MKQNWNPCSKYSTQNVTINNRLIFLTCLDISFNTNLMYYFNSSVNSARISSYQEGHGRLINYELLILGECILLCMYSMKHDNHVPRFDLVI
jgi:hypothetical protein